MNSEKTIDYKKGVSVVIPHGGKNRLPHLRTCLANLRQCADVGEIIVVELDETPFAERTARRWADKYVFLHLDGQFERARALNTGSAFAECEYVLWLDNDLLVPKDFITQAVAELGNQKLDFLKPYSEVKYLSLADTEKVMQGVLSPEECRAANVYYSTTTDGGAGIVRKSFLEKYGAIPVGFRGWGGEDNGWMHKVSLFGKAGRTPHKRKVTHLYHALSGGYGGSAHYKANPHYPANLDLLKQIKNVRDAKIFSEKFPPQKPQLWDETRKIIFVSDAKEQKKSASNIAEKLNELFDANVELKPSNQLTDFEKQTPDAIVFFDSQTAQNFLNKNSFARFAEKTIVITDENLSDISIEIFQNCFGVLITDEIAAEKFKASKINYWTWKNDESDEINHESFALAIAQPLSFLINRNEKAIAEKMIPAEVKSETADLPIWLYWEGACPEWIEACQKTILAHAPNARLLTPETFDELRDRDRDINMKNLHVAHRADYIRAFLLYRYGGMWIDADCVVLKSLAPLFEKLNGHDFAAHRERGGYFGNEFLIAKPESRIARAFYERLCKTLRSKRRFGWCDLGCVPLTDIINKSDGEFMEIECELIQPICWSEVAPYFENRTDGEHENFLDTNAFCYMLSNLTVNKFLKTNRNKNLLDEKTFFSFLVRQSLDQNIQKEFSISKNGNGSNGNNLKNGNNKISQKGNYRRQEIEFYLEAFEKIAPEKVLDADVGRGKWAVLLREMFSERKISIEAIAESQNESKIFYDHVHTGKLENCLQNFHEKKELVILGDHLSGISKINKRDVLEKSLNISDYVLLNVERENFENYAGFLSESNPGSVADYRSQKNSVMFLLSQNDPKNLRRKNKMTDIFTESARVCSRFEESLSGPGSSLEQTTEIRRRLPILFASLDINSMLDAPCGDFNWLRRIDLRLEKYVGIDIVPSIIEHNRKQFENGNRKFYISDMTADFLPRCDLIFCRDCLVHFSFEEIFATLRNFQNSGAEYFLTTTFPSRSSNQDIQTGDWRPLNFQLAPFNFPAPLRLINEHCTEGNGQYAG